MSRLVDRLLSRSLPVICIFLILAGTAGWLGWRAGRKGHDPLLDSPEIALGALQAKNLFFNHRARPWLLSRRPELLTEEDRDDASDRSRHMTQAVQSPKLFRQMDREYRFDALLFVGDPSEYRPLLDHLVERKDWTLRYVDHTSLVFRRDEGATWSLADFEPLRQRFARANTHDRAMVFSQTATKLLAAGHAEEGKKLLDEAAHFAANDPGVATGLAVYHLDRGEWKQASEQVERALKADDQYLPAMATKTQILYGSKQFSAAYDLSKQLIARVPGDPGLLFYHAKIAHEAHAYKAEIAALETLIARAEADDRPIGGYLLYLGQAYAVTSDAERSVDAFMRALNDPNLPDDQRSYARENIARIKKRGGL